jgi:hypothetical protein
VDIVSYAVDRLASDARQGTQKRRHLGSADGSGQCPRLGAAIGDVMSTHPRPSPTETDVIDLSDISTAAPPR